MSKKVYIDRDALLEAAKATDVYFQIKALLTDFPAADVAPREDQEMTFKNKINKYIDWCRQKIANKPRWVRENKYKIGYEDAMLAVMSMLHNEKGGK